MEDLLTRFEGKTEKTKNPYSRNNLAWAAINNVQIDSVILAMWLNCGVIFNKIFTPHPNGYRLYTFFLAILHPSKMF